MSIKAHSHQKQAIFWLLAFVMFFIVVWRLEKILLPFILGMATAYFLDPVVDRLEQYNWNRTLSVSVVLSLFAAFFAMLVFLIVPTLYTQILGLYNALPDYIAKLHKLFYTYFGDLLPDDLLTIASLENMDKESIKGLNGIGQGIFKTVLNSGQALMGFFSTLFITPVVAFYLLRDWDLMTKRLQNWLPHDHKKEIKKIFKDIDTTLAGFVRGQASVCFILGAFYSIALMIAGLSFGLFIGIGAGLTAFIPYFGAMIGLGVALIVAWFQFGDFSMMGIIAGIFFAGQMLEGNFLTPKLIGEKIGLHAVWVIFALMAGGELFGFVGVMIAVPTAAIIGVLIRFSLGLYLQSTYYKGTKAVNKKVKKKKTVS